jgi:NAD+ kinase
MKTVAIISKPAKPELASVIPQLGEWLRKNGYDVVADPETAFYDSHYPIVQRSEIAAKKPEFVIVLGGDGTLLAAARVVAKSSIPILAVNLGSLGFLTEVPLSELYQTLEAVKKNSCSRESRSLLDCHVMRGDKNLAEFIALNDVVITKGTIARMTEVDVTINGEFVANYKADGVIIATPTGSTAYSLAAGGPVLEPSVNAFVITPVSPHALTNRPLVVRDSVQIIMTIRGASEEAYLTADGQSGMPVREGDSVSCRKSSHHVHLLRSAGRTFFDVLRTKLKWGQR